jgi:hypothetical protein
MSVAKREVRARVIESLEVHQDDIGISPLVIRVTMAAFLLGRSRIAAVKTLTSLAISARVLVAGEAEFGLRSARERLVAIAAFLLELGVSGHERPGHDKLLEHILGSHG